jgi:hypothetical protein
MISNKYIRFVMICIFIVYLFDVINVNISTFTSGQTLNTSTKKMHLKLHSFLERNVFMTFFFFFIITSGLLSFFSQTLTLLTSP